ncbi:MAG TPA: RidA family protein, partial [Flavisolibacter sp.]|nr:RidA family protein [Flavisolibacter sp.]
VLLFITQVLSAQSKPAAIPHIPIEKKKFHFGADQDTAGGYTQAIKVDNVIYISGTVVLDITPESIRYVYKVIEKSLEPFGATLQNVVKETIFTTDIEAVKKYNNIRKEIYKADYPASSWIQVARLFMHEARLEIEVVAHLKK